MIRWKMLYTIVPPKISQIIEDQDVLLKIWLFYNWCKIKSKMATITIYNFWLAKITSDLTGTLWCQSEIQDGQQSRIWFKIGFCKMS